MVVSVTAMLFPVCCHAAVVAARFDEVFKNWTAAIASFVTALAVIAGGVWAYYEFVRGRTFHPRISIEVLGQWRATSDGQPRRSWLALQQQRPKAHVLHVRVRVTNIGAGKVMLRQYYTALYTSASRANNNRRSRTLLNGKTIWPRAPIQAVAGRLRS